MEPTQASPATCGASSAPGCSTFPMECVKHLAGHTCHCQSSAPDVDRNRHYASCMVGKAQAFLGAKVEEKPLFGGYHSSRLNPKLTVPPLSADTVGRVVGRPDSERK